MKKLKYILKLYYVINYIIFNFFITLIFLIRQIIKVDVKVKCDKHLGIERVLRYITISILAPHRLIKYMLPLRQLVSYTNHAIKRCDTPCL
jgi:lipopolysaccharide export LptBFGC system permease protein LptF